MGISIEQYCARIGTHNCHCIQMKHLTCLQDSFHCILLILFQLIIVVIMLIMFVRICYLSISCVTTTSTKISKPLYHCYTKSASHCATATNNIGKPLCHCHTIKSASHCATATNKIGKPLCHCNTIKSARPSLSVWGGGGGRWYYS